MIYPNYKEINTNLIKKYTRNSRKHSKQQVQQIVNSIKEFGFTNPLLVDENNELIAGHCRLDAAIELGLEQVPCIILSHLTIEQKALYVIADNKLALNADWDLTILQEEFMRFAEFDINLELTGFTLDELAEIMPQELPEVFCDEDDCPEVPAEPITKMGDVWILGDHRLLCGDSSVATDVERLLGGQHPNTMVTDPPYGVKLDMSWRETARPDGTKNNKNVVMNDDRVDWYDTYVLFPGAVAYVWHAAWFTDVVMTNLRDAGFECKQQIIWRKTNFVFGRSNYHWQHEPCWYAVKKGNKSNWKGDRKQTTVWDCDAPNRGGSSSKDDKTEHPAQKPVELFSKSILHHTNPGEYVYDPFAGSGTLMVACEKTKRRALMMELDPKYCDVIIKRWENYTGKIAVLEE